MTYRTDNESVVSMWYRGLSAESHNGNVSTDGSDLYSYSMKIGRTVGGEKQVLDVTAPNSYSATTSQHVGLAKRYADKIIEPACVNGWRYFPDEINGKDYKIHMQNQFANTKEAKKIRASRSKQRQKLFNVSIDYFPPEDRDFYKRLFDRLYSIHNDTVILMEYAHIIRGLRSKLSEEKSVIFFSMQKSIHECCLALRLPDNKVQDYMAQFLDYWYDNDVYSLNVFLDNLHSEIFTKKSHMNYIGRSLQNLWGISNLTVQDDGKYRFNIKSPHGYVL